MPIYRAEDNVSIHYESTGSGPTVLLLHALGLDLTFWEAQAEMLSASYRVVRMDFRGHGQSGTGAPPYSLELFAADAHGLLRSLDAAPAHVVGLSMGGMVAQVLAITYPEDLRSLTLCDTTCNFTPEGRASLLSRAEAAEQGGMECLVEATIKRWFTPGFLDAEIVARCRERLLTDRAEGWAGTCRAASKLNTEARLGEIRVPALAAMGDKDAGGPVERAYILGRAIPGARVHIFPDTPHMAPLERPDLFNPLLLGFLRQVDGKIASAISDSSNRRD